MSLALLALCLLCNRPANAQGGDPPPVDPGHYWKVTPTPSGTLSDAIPDYPYDGLSTAESYSWDPGEVEQVWGIGGYVSTDLYTINASTVGTSGPITLTWVPTAGKSLLSDPPDEPVTIKEHAFASEASFLSSSGSGGSADDGLGDPSLPFLDGYACSGTHYLQKDGSTGEIKLDAIALSAKCPTSSWGSPPGSFGYYCWDRLGGHTVVGFDVTVIPTPIPRAVTISCPDLDPTSYKLADPSTPTDANGDPNFIPTPHVPAADGTMSGDVGLPICGASMYFTPIKYHANVVGDWQIAGSSYNWFSSLKQQGDNGSLYPPDFTNSYLDPWWVVEDPSALTAATTLAPGETDSKKPDHINIKCIDGGDGFVATANYFMTLHPAIENNYPDHVNSDFINPRQVSVNLISSGPTDPLGGGISVQIDYALSASADGPVAKLIAGILGINVTFTVEKDFATISNVGTIGLPAGWYTYVLEYDHYYDHYGKADNWGMSGYAGTSPYTIREVPKLEADRFGLKMAPMQQVGGPSPGH